MSSPRLKFGWYALNADNGDILLTALAGGEQRLTNPPPPIRELVRRLAAGESLSGFGAMLQCPEAQADELVGGWLGQLSEMGVLDVAGDPLPEEWGSRYDAQMAFFSAAGIASDSGLAAQQRLATKTVALLGAGPVNAWLAYHLAVAGVGRLHLIDAGHVEPAEVPGHPLWRLEDVGQLKATAFAMAIGRLNLNVKADGSVVEWQDGREAAVGLTDVDLALVDLGGRGLWDPRALDRGAQHACFVRQIPTYLVVANAMRVQWGPLLVPGVGACYSCLAGKLFIPETQRLVDRGRSLAPKGTAPGVFPPFVAEAAALAMPEILLFLTGMLSAEQLQRTSFFHVPGRALHTVTIGPEAMCEWCGVGTPAYAERSRQYARLDVRPMAFAGKSYPPEPGEADAEVGAYFRHSKGPAPRMPRGIIAPHIEPRLGQVSYGHAYGAFPAGGFPRRVIVLSTSHYPQSRVVALSAKPFATPWGLVNVDRTAIERIAKAVGGNPYADEALFGYEHAIEFPTIFLERARRLAGAPPITIVPVLCGSLHEAMVRQRHPMEMGEVAAFVGMLQELVAEDPDGTCIVSSIDLSHVGPRYGDPQPLNPEELANVRTWDQRLLGELAEGHSTAYWESVASVANGTRICGLTPMFLQVAALPECRGDTRHYELSLDEASRSHIGHAAMLLYPQSEASVKK